jgi:hypothetical protein
MCTKFWSENLGVDGRIILEWVTDKRVGSYGLDASGSGYGPVGGSCEHSNETSGFLKGGESLD